MDAIRIINGLLYSCHYIYVKDYGKLSDDDLLKLLQLKGYSNNHISPKFTDIHANIMRNGDWLALTDDWRGTVYHSKQLKKAMKLLAKEFEVLRTTVGDADDSFQFYYYVGGKEVRAFHYDVWGTRPPRVITNSGTPFRCEADFNLKDNPWGHIQSVAKEVGIDSEKLTSSLKSYIMR